jgi:transposase
LREWVADAQASAAAGLRSFATGLLSDWDAVAAAVAVRWSSGIVERHTNRIKFLKRHRFGRAKTTLLRKRILLTN